MLLRAGILSRGQGRYEGVDVSQTMFDLTDARLRPFYANDTARLHLSRGGELTPLTENRE